MKNLYDFYWDCGRQGEVEGRFLATPKEIENLIGKKVQFGEILGKHSDIYGIIEEGDITLITDNQQFIKEASRIGVDLCFGYNPIHYYTCPECGWGMDLENNKCSECDYIEED